ncbi:hypothetical protein J2W46_002998 [Paraburkholderia strydomiana]|nr:hypothetical protein [Paraburkholderia strydomiana]
MHKETIAASANGATSLAGIGSSWWLWLTDPNSAHVVSVLTMILILSQLVWGWRKFFKERS